MYRYRIQKIHDSFKVHHKVTGKTGNTRHVERFFFYNGGVVTVDKNEIKDT